MKEVVVMFPSSGMGHLIPTVELAKLFTTKNLSVTIILIETPFSSFSTVDPFAARVTAAHPTISFHHLPPLSPPPTSSYLDLFRLANPHLSSFLTSQTLTVRALVLDMFCTAALDVAADLRIPSFFFFSSSASSLATFLYFSTMQSKLLKPGESFKGLGDAPLDFPGLPPVPASQLPDMMKDLDDPFGRVLVANFDNLPRADGIMVNSFEALERRALEALTAGLCVPGRRMPPVYLIGPVMAGGDREGHECLAWLDGQPKGSVVFLCFGSMGAFPVAQLKEIALGLERSGQRFLWVVRNPPPDGDGDPKKRFGTGPEAELGALMPEGFLERSEGRGMVVKSWAPQVAVLAHEAVGGFVSHCGWNSTLEAVSAGVPVVAWPLYAEQKLNRVFLVEEAKVAVAVEGYDEGIVKAEEVERKVRWLMEEGGELRERAKALKAAAAAAKEEGGSSQVALMDLVKVLRSSD